MKKTALLAIILVLFVLCASACTRVNESSDETESVTEAPTVTPTETEAETEPPVYVYSGATEDFLTPLDDYSWEREFPPEFVVIHFTSNVVNDRANPYDMTAIRKIFEDGEVSIHYIIDRGGEVYCYIPEDRAAWHAGRGEWADEKYTDNMNRYSIGVELLAVGSSRDMASYLHEWEYDALEPEDIGFTDAQYEALAALVRDICERNNIPLDRDHIIGHGEYSPTKTDPGELFDWERIFE